MNFAHFPFGKNKLLSTILAVSVMLFSASSCEKYPDDTTENDDRETEEESTYGTDNETDSGLVVQPLVDTILIELPF